MRPDAGAPPPFAEQEGPYPFLEVEGDGVYEIPVGHALACCLAVEEATGTHVPAAARRARALLLELERLHNHVADLGMLCNDVGHGILNAHAQRVREQLLRLDAEVTGHRLLRGGVVPGGAVLRALPDTARLTAIGRDIREIAGLALAHSTVRDRFTGTAVLTADAARDLGCLGYVARASGPSGTDARVAHPFAAYDTEVSVPVRDGGDVPARFLVRAEEIDVSLALVEHLAEDLGPGTWGGPPAPGQAGGSGVGIVEGWRGTITTRVELGPDGRLAHVKPVDPSFYNWPALPLPLALALALADTIVPDFPLTNKSFNLSYAGNDL
ncbi:hypothetical protein [Streptomyces sp. NPDC012756]|uniref:NADH-quinone oxidoreductase subunit D-related protein n=1 Tax=Streptomyces sp. NPDC012756 TaxID=3364847 RepID=UPI0036A6C365